MLIGTEGSRFQPLPFPQSPRAAATQGGSAFDRFAACSGSPTPDRLIPCDWPHRYEFLADAFVVRGTEAASLASCRAAITELTGLADATAGHRLDVRLLTYIFGVSGDARTVSYDEARAEQGSATCAIAPTSADEMLTGTLYGLDHRPLPIG